MPRLTKQVVDAATPTEKDFFIWDEKLSGFGLRVFNSGRKSYLIQYRSGGRTRRFTIGAHGTLTADEARNRARALLVQVNDGHDPAEDRRINRHGITMTDLCDRYIREYIAVYNKKSTAKEFKRLINTQIVPALGKRKISSITRYNILELHQKMRGTPRQANQTLAVLSKMFSLAEAWGLRSEGTSPCRLIRKFPEKIRCRYFSDDEMKRLGSTLRQLDESGEILPSISNAIRILAMTGCRLGEVLNLKWEDVDFENKTLLLVDAKGGTRIHPIGNLVIDLFSGIGGQRQGPWIFYGRDAKKPLSTSSIESAWRRIREKAKLEDARIHDLRHTVGSYAGQTGANAYLIRDKLGHKTLAMTSRYVNQSTHGLHMLSNKVETRISKALQNTTNSKERN